MQIVIEIPKEFEEDFNTNKLSDCFGRIIADIDYSLRHAECMCAGNYEKETVEMLMGAFVNGTPLPKGHGDLIDRSKIYKAIPAEEDNCTGIGMTLEEMDAYNEGIDAMYSLVKGARPIIEADKESEVKE